MKKEDGIKQNRKSENKIASSSDLSLYHLTETELRLLARWKWHSFTDEKNISLEKSLTTIFLILLFLIILKIIVCSKLNLWPKMIRNWISKINYNFCIKNYD